MPLMIHRCFSLKLPAILPHPYNDDHCTEQEKRDKKIGNKADIRSAENPRRKQPLKGICFPKNKHELLSTITQQSVSLL